MFKTKCDIYIIITKENIIKQCIYKRCKHILHTTTKCKIQKSNNEYLN